MDKVAVLIPVFNDPKGLETTINHLSECLEYSRLTLVVVDDGSALPLSLPRTWQADSHLICLGQNQGIVGALNVGLAWILEQDFRYIARLDAGDIPYPQRFAKQLGCFVNNPNLGLVGTHTEFVEPSGKLLYVWRPPTEIDALRHYMHLQNPFVHSSVMYSSEVLRNIGPYREGFPAAEDYELFFRIARRYEVAMLGEVLMRCDLDPKGISVRSRHKQLRSIQRVRWLNFKPGFWESYAGIARGVVSSLLPFSWVNGFKQLVWRS